jgi:hypothetical protein
MEVSGRLHIPATLPPGKEPWYPLDRRLGGPQNRSAQHEEEKNFAPTGTRTPNPRSFIQPAASCYTDWAIAALILHLGVWKEVIKFSACSIPRRTHKLYPLLFLTGKTRFLLKNSIFWVITPCSPLKVNWSFGEICRLHLQGQRIIQARN